MEVPMYLMLVQSGETTDNGGHNGGIQRAAASGASDPAQAAALCTEDYPLHGCRCWEQSALSQEQDSGHNGWQCFVASIARF